MTQVRSSSSQPALDMKNATESTAAPKQIACPICATQFNPRASGGVCPVCGEQVVPATQVTREIPLLTRSWRWVAAGGWRLILFVLFLLYQIVMLAYIWHGFAVDHLLG